MTEPSDATSRNGAPAGLARFLPKGVLGDLTTEASGAFGLYIAGTALSFLFSLALGRLLGAAGTGVFFLALTVASVAALVGRLGMDNALLRFTAAFAGEGAWGRVAGVERTGIRLAVASSAAAALLLLLSSGWLATALFETPALVVPLRIMALAVVPMALARLYGEMLKGISRTRTAILVESVLIPLLALPALLVTVPWLGVRGAVLAHLGAAAGALAFGWWRWRRAVPNAGVVSGAAFPLGRLLETSLPLLWVAGMDQLMRTVDMVALGAWRSASEVGVYAVAARVSIFTSFVLVAVNAVAAPRFAALHHRGELERLEVVARKTTLLIAVLTLPILLVLLGAPGWVLGLFGPEFRAGVWVLVILVAGQIVNAVTGPVGYLLMMSGHEKLMRNNIVVAAAVNVSLNLWLVPRHGAVGAAVATAASLALMNVVSAVLVHRSLGIVTLPLVRGRRTDG